MTSKWIGSSKIQIRIKNNIYNMNRQKRWKNNKWTNKVSKLNNKKLIKIKKRIY